MKYTVIHAIKNLMEREMKCSWLDRSMPGTVWNTYLLSIEFSHAYELDTILNITNREADTKEY